MSGINSPSPATPFSPSPGLVDFSRINQVRWEQTERELTRLEADFRAWMEHRREQDQAGTSGLTQPGQKLIHATRLDALEKVFSDALAQIKWVLNKTDLGAGRDSVLVYDDCRVIDFALVWLKRVWEFYRVKFDQRDDTAGVARVLDAADELVWSCYKQIFINPAKLPAGVVIGPAPLPFISPQYSPGAYEHGKPTPEELKASGIDLNLEKNISTLPVPLLRLPPWCVHSPWWLIFAAHEIGHHIQYELHLQDALGEKLFKDLKLAQVGEAEAGRWKNWSQEIFADLFSLMMVGPAALRALAEIERTQPVRMAHPREKYPAPAVRLELLRRAANRLFKPLKKDQVAAALWEQLPKDAAGLALPGGDAALAGWDPLAGLPAAAPARVDLSRLETVLDSYLGEQAFPFAKFENLCSLEAVRGWLADAGQGVAGWSNQLRRSGADKPGSPTPALTTPRLIAASAIDAWEKSVALTPAAARSAALEALAQNTIDVLLVSGPPGVRGEALKTDQAEGKGLALAEAILSLGRSQLAEISAQGG